MTDGPKAPRRASLRAVAALVICALPAEPLLDQAAYPTKPVKIV